MLRRPAGPSQARRGVLGHVPPSPVATAAPDRNTCGICGQVWRRATNPAGIADGDEQVGAGRSDAGHHDGAVSTDQVVRLAVGVVALLAVALTVQRLAGLRQGAAAVTALARGAVQLAFVGLVLGGVLAGSPAWTVVVVAVMYTTATVTASRRLRGLAGAGRAVLLACAGGALTALALVFALGVLPAQPRYVIALTGIVMGGTMTTATLAGRHLLSGLRARRQEVEGWLALGASPRRAVLDVARTAAREALVPALDQTRTTGLVTLPGAFVGALLGGADPLQAARFQLVVLAALVASGSVVAVVVTTVLGAPRTLPADGASR